MFPIFTDADVRLPLTWDDTYVLNSGDNARDIIEINSFTVRDTFSGNIEAHQQRDGFEAYRAHHNSKIIRIGGVVRKANHVAAMNAFAELAGRFDPSTLYEANRALGGFRNLQWTIGADGHRYEARPIQTPDLIHNEYQGSNVPFQIDLLANPVRKTNPVAGTVASGATVTNGGDAVGFPIITRTLSGAGPAAWTLTNSRSPEPTPLTIDLSSYSSGTITVNMESRQILHNGNPIDHRITDYGWWGLHPGANVITWSSGTVSMIRFSSYWSK